MSNRFYQQWINRRRNPFTDQETPAEKQETGLTIPTSAPYVIQLVEVPYKEQPSSVTVYNVTDSEYMTETSSSPAQGQFRVDYPEPNGEGTGLIEFNSADAGKVVNVSYKGTGSPIVTEFLDSMVEGYTPTFGIGASDTIRNSNDTERYKIYPTDWTKIKEIKINEAITGTLKVVWDMKGDFGDYTVYSRLCVNGVQIGSDKSRKASTYATFSETITGGLSQNDLVQIWVKSAGDEDVYIRNMRLCYDGALTDISGYTLLNPLFVTQDKTLDVTNQDPI
jgi:hypothetical protein